MADDNKIIDPFVVGQQVFLLDTNTVEIDKIRSGITPEIVTIVNFNDISKYFNTRYSTGNDAFATLIISNENIPGDIQQYFNNFVDGIETILRAGLKLFTFEINPKGDKIFPDSVLAKDVDDFVMKANNIHVTETVKNGDVNEEAKTIINSLQVENNKLSALNDDLANKIEITTEEKTKLENKIETLGVTIDSYKVRAETGDKKQEEAKQLIEQNKHQVEVLHSQLDDVNAELRKAKDEIIDYKTTIASNESTIEQYIAEGNVAFQTETELREQVQSLERMNNELQKAKTEIEGSRILNEELTATRNKLAESKKDLVKAQTDLKIKDHNIASLNDKIDQIRHGAYEIERVGYSNEFQDITLSSRQVFYFKVIDQLPFHRFYIKKMIEFVTDTSDHSQLGLGITKRFVTVILKINEGIDDKRFADYSVISDLGDIDDTNDKYILIPSQNMGENTEAFDQRDNDILVFIDYIDNDKIYVHTSAIEEIYSVVQRARNISDYGLTGTAISYDHGSIINLHYDQSIVQATSLNQEKEYLNRLIPFITQSDIIAVNSR